MAEIVGRALVDGRAVGEVLVLDQPLSFWGGLDPATGAIIDTHHPQRGRVVSGRILVMPAGRGSSSSSSVLAESLRRRTGPAAILLRGSDEIVALGALVVKLLDGDAYPVLELAPADYDRLADGDSVEVAQEGTVSVLGPGS